MGITRHSLPKVDEALKVRKNRAKWARFPLTEGNSQAKNPVPPGGTSAFCCVFLRPGTPYARVVRVVRSFTARGIAPCNVRRPCQALVLPRSQGLSDGRQT
jgi:hypothetical protein